MTVSLRLPLIAGTAAALTAGAIVAVPAGHPERLAQALASSTAEVSLSGLANPFTELLGSLELTQDYLLGSYYAGASDDFQTPGSGAENWPFAGFGQLGGDALNELLYFQKSLGYNSYVGNLPNSTANATPIVQQLQINLSGYANAGISGLIAAGAAISDGIWAYPSELVTAAQFALAGQFSEAVGVLVGAVVGPATVVVDSLLAAGAFIGGSIIARLGAVIAAVPAIVTKFVGWAIGGTALLAEQSAAIASTWIAQVASLNLEGAWNTAVNGLFGPAGLPGTALNLSLGAGIQTGPILAPSDIADNFVPSLRTAVNSAVWTIQDAMSTSIPLSGAAVPAAEVTEVAEVASPRAAIAEAQAGDAQAGDTQSGDAKADDAKADDAKADDTQAGDAGSAATGTDAPAGSRGAAASNRKDGAATARGAEHRGLKRAAASGE